MHSMGWKKYFYEIKEIYVREGCTRQNTSIDHGSINAVEKQERETIM